MEACACNDLLHYYTEDVVSTKVRGRLSFVNPRKRSVKGFYEKIPWEKNGL